MKISDINRFLIVFTKARLTVKFYQAKHLRLLLFIFKFSYFFLKIRVVNVNLLVSNEHHLVF